MQAKLSKRTAWQLGETSKSGTKGNTTAQKKPALGQETRNRTDKQKIKRSQSQQN